MEFEQVNNNLKVIIFKLQRTHLSQNVFYYFFLNIFVLNLFIDFMYVEMP